MLKRGTNKTMKFMKQAKSTKAVNSQFPLTKFTHSKLDYSNNHPRFKLGNLMALLGSWYNAKVDDSSYLHIVNIRNIIMPRSSSAILIAFFALLSLVSTIGFCNNTYADAGTLTLTVSSDTLSFDLVPTRIAGTFAHSDNLTVGVTLEGGNGYALTIRAANSTDLVNTEDGSKVIQSLTSAVTPANFESSSDYNNRWGYLPSKLNSVANTDYQPAPTLEGDLIERTSGPDTSGTYTMSLGARVNMDVAPGAYTNTFVITAVTNSTCNPSAGSIIEAYCMQDMNDSVANSMVIGKQYQLMDERDNNMYYVAKMKDGRVWMTQNLDFSIPTTGLTSEKTDLTTFGSQNYTTANGYDCSNSDASCSGGVITWTPSHATSTSWNDSLNEPYSYEGGTNYYYTDTSGNTTTYTTKEACEAVHSDGSCGHYHSGNYYNFTAAVASNNTSGITSGTMGNSVCPKGWRLPTANAGTTSDADETWYAEGVMTDFITNNGLHSDYTSNGYIKMSNAPLYLTRTGFKTSSLERVGTSGYYRTNRVTNKSNAYMYYFNATHPYPLVAYPVDGVGMTRNFQTSVRCIARQSNSGGSTTITFDKNAAAATGTMANKVINAGAKSTLTSNAYVNSGYVFNGWNTESDGTGVSYANGADYYASVGTLPVKTTLYAQWAPAHTITVQSDTDIKVSVDSGNTWTAAGDSATLVAGEGQTILLEAKDDTAGTVFDNWTKELGVGEFTTTPQRSASTKTTAFVVGVGDATVKANSTTTYTTIDAGSTTPMQSVTACPDWLTTGTMYQVTDSRDSEVYNVAKLADGKCWLLDNLRLGSNDNAINLTPEDTNITTNYTLPKGITSGFSSYTDKQINAAYKNNVAPTIYGSASGKVGTYYNYCAASAETVCSRGDTTDATVDICPAGWRLPTGGPENKTTGRGEYYSLYNAYGRNQANYKAALSLSLSGSFNGSTQGRLGSDGYWWSSTFRGGFRSCYLRANSSDVTPTDTNDRHRGFSVRCVLSN